MSLLYKDQKDITVSVAIRQLDGQVEVEFSSNCGKFGTDEMLAAYNLTPARLLDILSSTKDYEDHEII